MLGKVDNSNCLFSICSNSSFMFFIYNFIQDESYAHQLQQQFNKEDSMGSQQDQVPYKVSVHMYDCASGVCLLMFSVRMNSGFETLRNRFDFAVLEKHRRKCKPLESNYIHST